jgi:hypothetical protein
MKRSPKEESRDTQRGEQYMKRSPKDDSST